MVKNKSLLVRFPMYSSRSDLEVSPGARQVAPIDTDAFGANFEADLRRIFRSDSKGQAVSRLLVVLALLPAVIVLIIGLSRESSPRPVSQPVLQPIDFKLIRERYARIGSTRAEVERLLGEPTRRDVIVL